MNQEVLRDELERQIRAPFTREEAIEFDRLLRKLKDLGGYVPDEAFHAWREVTTSWAAEMIIFRGNSILLRVYEGEDFRNLWHIPGGYNRFTESLEETCSRIAREEIGVDVRCGKVFGAEKWGPGSHPHGRPLSVYVRCEPLGRIVETETMRFFSKAQLKDPALRVVPIQSRFLLKHLPWLYP